MGKKIKNNYTHWQWSCGSCRSCSNWFNASSPLRSPLLPTSRSTSHRLLPLHQSRLCQRLECSVARWFFPPCAALHLPWYPQSSFPFTLLPFPSDYPHSPPPPTYQPNPRSPDDPYPSTSLSLLRRNGVTHDLASPHSLQKANIFPMQMLPTSPSSPPSRSIATSTNWQKTPIPFIASFNFSTP